MTSNPIKKYDKMTLGYRLKQDLGPEFLSERKGPGNIKLQYIESWRLLDLANEIFGFDGWSHSIVKQEIDFIDCIGDKFNVGVSTIVRVTLKDGTFHEDIGYGQMENSRIKGAAIEKVY